MDAMVSSVGCELQRESTEKQIENKISQAKKQVEKLERLQAIFKRHPDLQETLDLLRQVSIF